MRNILNYNINSLASNLLIVAAGQFFSILLNLALLSLLTRVLTIEDFGYFQLFLASVLGLSFFTFPGFNQVAIKGAAKGDDGVLLLSYQFRIYGGLFLSGVMAIAGFVFWWLEIKSPLGVLLMLGSLYILVLPLQTFDSFLIGKNRFDLSKLISVCVALLKLVIVGGIAWITIHLVYVIIAYIAVELFAVLAGQNITQKHIINKNLSDKYRRYYRQYGFRMSGLAGLGVFSQRLEQIILGLLRPELLAVYNIGALIPKRIQSNIIPFLGVINVRWIKLSRPENVEKIKKYWWLFLGGGIVVFIAIWFIIPCIIPVFFGQDYLQSIWIARYLSFPLIFHFFYRSMINVAIYQGGEQFYTKIQIIFSALKIVLFLILVPVYQIPGAIIAYLSIEFFLFVTTLIWFISRILNVKGV